MDASSSGLEITSEQLITLGDDFGQENFQTSKSFRCTFCKRGFSNAQALGGHMNIHRKDRAKLREFSDENLLSLEIGDHEGNLPRNPLVQEKLSSEMDGDKGELSRLSYVKGRPLQLFAEAVAPGTGESREVELKYGEIDLELRLGPEPNHDAKSKP